MWDGFSSLSLFAESNRVVRLVTQKSLLSPGEV